VAHRATQSVIWGTRRKSPQILQTAEKKHHRLGAIQNQIVLSQERTNHFLESRNYFVFFQGKKPKQPKKK
jgi:hypothetical protein